MSSNPTGNLPSKELPPDTNYFSAADRQMESFLADRAIRRNKFEESLLNNLLFESAVVVPDIFFFISSGLADHVLSSKDDELSLLQEGIRAGLVIPAFRDKETASFEEAYERVKGVRGQRSEAECLAIARRLDYARTQAEGRFRSTTWPDPRVINVGDEYAKRLKKFFREEPPLTNPKIRDIWDRTEIWRTSCLDEAIDMGPSQGGFRRGDYMQVLGRTLGATDEINDVLQLFRAPAWIASRRPRQLRHCVFG